ncbi:hypothetical protein Hanom_Chr00s073000g01789601 [Helianthus anomalus]
MVEIWWIRRWYFLYISVSIMLPNFCTTCHVKYCVCEPMVRILNVLCCVKRLG